MSNFFKPVWLYGERSLFHFAKLMFFLVFFYKLAKLNCNQSCCLHLQHRECCLWRNKKRRSSYIHIHQKARCLWHLQKKRSVRLWRQKKILGLGLLSSASSRTQNFHYRVIDEQRVRFLCCETLKTFTYAVSSWTHKCMDWRMEIDGRIDGWVDRWIDGCIEGSSDGQIDRSIDALIDGWMDRWMNRWMDRWIDRWMDGSMDGSIHGWMDGYNGFSYVLHSFLIWFSNVLWYSSGMISKWFQESVKLQSLWFEWS